MFDYDDNEPIASFVHAKGQVIMQLDHTDSDQKYFYLHDRLGSVRQVIDKDANVKNCYTYDPWGLTIGDETDETVFNPYRFGGYFWEPEISQYHCFRRQYDPVLARFTSRDPVIGDFKEPLTLHAYLYCLNDPINLTDPTGKFADIYLRQKDANACLVAQQTLMQKIKALATFANAMRSGTMNAMFGPDSTDWKLKFAIGFVAGTIEMQVGFRKGAALGSGIAAAFTSSLNEAFSDDKFLSWETAGRIGVDAIIGATMGAFGDSVSGSNILTGPEIFMIGLDSQLLSAIYSGKIKEYTESAIDWFYK